MADKELSSIDQLTESLKKVPANLLGGPVDLTNLALGLVQGKGLEGSVKDPVGGSASFMKLFRQNPDSSGPVEDIASFAAGMVNPSAATKTAITASALLGGKILANSKPVVSLLGDVGKVPDMVKATDALTKTTTEAAMIPALLAGGSASKFGQKVAESGKSAKEVLKEVRKKKAEGASVEDIYHEFGVVQGPGTKKWDAVILNPELGINTSSGKVELGTDKYSPYKETIAYNLQSAFDSKTTAGITDYLTDLSPEVTKALSGATVDSGFMVFRNDGAFSPSTNRIQFSSANVDTVKGLLSHEIQHALDTKFNRPSGGSSSLFASDELEQYADLASNLARSLPYHYSKTKAEPKLYYDKIYSEPMMDIIDSSRAKLREAERKLNSYAYDQYRGLAGEVKAKAVQNLTDTQDEANFLREIQKPVSVSAPSIDAMLKMGLDQKYKTDLAPELELMKVLEKFAPPKVK